MCHKINRKKCCKFVKKISKTNVHLPQNSSYCAYVTHSAQHARRETKPEQVNPMKNLPGHSHSQQQ